MAKKNHVVNIKAAQSLIQHLDTVEQKLLLIRQSINPELGVVTEMNAVAGLFLAVQKELIEVNVDLVRFL